MVDITKSIEWEMGHRIPNHESKCRNPHGHRYRMELTISGELSIVAGDSSEGMVLDFKFMKKCMEERIHDILDHGFMIYEKDRIWSDFFNTHAEEKYKVLQVQFIPTVENIAKWCYEQLQDCFPNTLTIKNIRIFETPSSWADYRPDD
jgi:6-pyruvoyltetrahydropterin/6-carboxytetrahydropterin synthase